jgi:very-short-patch-repair endonuclease
VEIDGMATHATAEGRGRDIIRDTILERSGVDVKRFSAFMVERRTADTRAALIDKLSRMGREAVPATR